jgi:radical SAM superfamily enzyme YgiQ (UPF0313 family)
LKADGKKYNLPPTDLPLGLLSLSGYLKKHVDVDVKLIDFNTEVVAIKKFPFHSFHDYVLDTLDKIDFAPDIVGITCLFSPSYRNFLEAAAAARGVFPDALLIGGGNVPTSAYREVFDDPLSAAFDGLCFGEGELPLLDLVRAADRSGHIQDSRNWITRAKLDTDFHPEHRFIEDLDEIPFMDYGLCDVAAHNSNLVVSSFAPESRESRKFHVMTSRGCPFLCTFCASHAVHGRKMRFQSLDRVREDFRRLRDEYGADTLIVQDDHFMADRDRVFTILGMLRELGLHSIYQNGLSLYALDRPMLEAFHAAGVRQLVLAVESGSQRVLKELMKKPLKFEISQRVARDCRELGIYTNANILIGMPGETDADIAEGRRNLKDLGVNWFHVNCASPLIGSEMHRVAKTNGFIRGKTLGADYKMAVIETNDFSTKYLQDMQYLINLELNFVNNADMRFGEYEIALLGFKNVIAVKSDHAFAFYYAAACLDRLGRIEEAKEHYAKYKEYVSDPFWMAYAEHFGLESAPVATVQ